MGTTSQNLGAEFTGIGLPHAPVSIFREGVGSAGILASGLMIENQMNPKRVYGSYTAIRILVV